MNEKINRAMMEGFSILLSSIFKTAAQKGLAIMILLATIAAQTMLLFEMDTRQCRAIDSFENKIERMNRDCAASINAAREDFRQCREDFRQCEAERGKLADKVSELSFKISRLEKRR